MRRLIAAGVLFAAASRVPAQATHYDLLITNGTIIDGSGAARYRGDVAMSWGRIVRVERASIPRTQATRVIDASGLIVAPGFIDLHAHLEPLPQTPDAQSAAMQGVTLALGGPDGGGPWPFGPYLDSLDHKPLGIDVAFLAGHNSIRKAVMGTENRLPTAAELARMQSMVGQSMHEGAFGMSTGLMWGKSVVTLHMVDSARNAGTDVMIDQYPYTASSTSLDVLVPPWALAGGTAELKKRLANPALKDSITRGVIEYLLNDRGGGDLHRVQFARVTWDHSLEGKTLFDWAVRRHVPTTRRLRMSKARMRGERCRVRPGESS